MQVVVRQFSGLGNQLFQYAAGRYYAKRYGASMRMALDPPRRATSHGYARPFLLSHFSIAAPAEVLSISDRIALADRRWLKPVKDALGVQVVRESVAQRYTFRFDLPVGENVRTLYLVGYWQTHDLVEAVAEELRVELSFKEPAKGRNLEVLRDIQGRKNPVSLHVRRGDYTLAAEGNIALPISYYSEAIRVMREQLGDPTFFVFSDDVAYARANLPLEDGAAVFVDHNDDLSSHEDLRLMSSCRHHIIANSTFSWWGAWLNARPDKVVFAPRYWQLRRDSHHPELFSRDWILASDRLQR